MCSDSLLIQQILTNLKMITYFVYIIESLNQPTSVCLICRDIVKRKVDYGIMKKKEYGKHESTGSGIRIGSCPFNNLKKSTCNEEN